MTLPSEDRERLLVALRRADPPAFRSQVRAVLVAHGSVVDAARALRVREAALRRWIDDDAALVAGVTLE